MVMRVRILRGGAGYIGCMVRRGELTEGVGYARHMSICAFS